MNTEELLALVSPKKYDKKKWYYMACTECGWHGPSGEADGFDPIGDTGDYDDGYCPECSADLMDLEMIEPYLKALHDRLRRLAAGEVWPVRKCEFCAVELSDRKDFVPHMCMCSSCWAEYEEHAKSEGREDG